MKKIKSILLSALLIVASLSGLTTVCQALDTDDTIYPGDKVTVTYSFTKDIPEGCNYYYFETNYPIKAVKYNSFENHWVLKPRIDKVSIYYYKIVPVQGMTADNSHYGPQVKAGQKIISVIYDVIKEARVSDLKFPIVELELGINNQYGLLKDSSYLSYDVKITSKGEKPTEPTTVAPTTTEPTTEEPTTEEPTEAPTTVEPTTVAPTTVEPTTVEPTTVEPTTVEPTTEPTDAPATKPTTVEPTTAPTTVPTTTQPTTTEPTEEPIATNPATVPTVSQPSTSADSTTATDSSTVASVTSDVTNIETTISANPSANGKSDSTNDEVNSNTNNSQNGNQNDNGVVKTGVPSMSMIVLVIMISSLAVIYFVRKRVK